MTTDSDLITAYIAAHDVRVPTGQRSMTRGAMRAAVRGDTPLPDDQPYERLINGVYYGYNAEGELLYTEKE